MSKAVHIDLFAGIGGFSLAARNVGLTFAATYYSEIDPKPAAVYARNFPDARPLGDITRIDTKALNQEINGRDVVITGGFPCQDISTAGSRQGISGSRSGLWGHYRRLIADLRPKVVVIENVALLARSGLERVLFPLAALGYAVEWACLRADAYGAVHQRRRFYAVAYPDGDAGHVVDCLRPSVGRDVGEGGEPDRKTDGSSIRLEWETAKAARAFRGQPLASRVDDGVSDRLDRVKMLGNAVHVPTVEAVYRRVIAAGLLNAPAALTEAA